MCVPVVYTHKYEKMSIPNGRRGEVALDIVLIIGSEHVRDDAFVAVTAHR